MSTLNKNTVTVTKVLNSKTNVDDFLHIGSDPKYASVYVRQEKVVHRLNTITGSTYADIVQRVAWINGETQILKKLYTHVGQVLEGNIIRLKSFTPFYEGQQPAINQQTKQPVLVDGKVYYFKDVLDVTCSLSDTWITPPSAKEEVEELA